MAGTRAGLTGTPPTGRTPRADATGREDDATLTPDTLPLARHLIAELPWLHGTSPVAVARACREVSAAGWTAAEVLAWVRLRCAPASVRNPIAFLRHRLRGAAECWSTPELRQRGVQQAQQAPVRERWEDLGPLDRLPAPPPEIARQILAALDHGARIRAARDRARGLSAAYQDTVELPPEVSEAELAAARSDPDWPEVAAAFAALQLPGIRG